jgi:hypothetical protein
MRARELAGAAALGLVASLLAHTAIFGRGHIMGAAYHQVLLGLAGLALTALVGSAVSLAWSAAGRISAGSVLAVRLRSVLPRWPMLCFATAAWLLSIEAVEPRHDPAPIALLLAAIVLASLLVLATVRALLSILASIAIAVRSTKFADRAPSWPARFVSTPRARRLHRARRLYARPPPDPAVTGA